MYLSYYLKQLSIILRICVLKFEHFIISVGQLSGEQHANIITLFRFNSRILVEDFVVGTCNSCMFLVFHEFQMKYSAGV